MRLLSILAAAALLTGCFSVDDVRERPIAWSATYPMAFDELTNCLAARSAMAYIVTPQIYQREKRANLTLGAKGGYSVVAEYRLRQVSDTTTEVDFREIRAAFGERNRLAREAADRCAKES